MFLNKHATRRGYRKLTLRFNFENAERYMPTVTMNHFITIILVTFSFFAHSKKAQQDTHFIFICSHY